MDGDSDSLSEFRDFSPIKSPLDEDASGVSFQLNGHPYHNGNQSNRSGCNLTNGRASNEKPEASNDSKTQQMNSDRFPAGHGSPLRSQLGLSLKQNHSVATSSKQSSNIVQCPLCPYSSENAGVLEEHINRSHFDPLSPSANALSSHAPNADTLNAFACPICPGTFGTATDLELHVNIEHRDILSPAKIDLRNDGASVASTVPSIGQSQSVCPVCGISLDNLRTQDVEYHIEKHFSKSPQPQVNRGEPNIERDAQKLREQREFEMLRAQYGMDDQGNFREQSAAAMQSAVYAGEMSVADYYERQVGLRAAESHGIDDNTSCSKSIIPRVLTFSANSPGVIKALLCSSIDHYASSYGDKGWGCGYRNLQMLLSSLLQNTTYHEALYAAWGSQGPARTAMPSISRLQKLVEAAWAQGFDVQVGLFVISFHSEHECGECTFSGLRTTGQETLQYSQMDWSDRNCDISVVAPHQFAAR